MLCKSKVIQKYGANLRIYENGKLITELFYPKSLKTELKFLDRSYVGYVTNLKNFISLKGGGDKINKQRVQSCVLCNTNENLKFYRITPPSIKG